MAVAIDRPVGTWRNFAGWSAVGAAFYLLVILGGALLVEGVIAIPRSGQVVAILGLGLLFSTAVIGFSSRKRPVSFRALRNFVIQNLVALAAFLLAIWGFRSFGGAGAMGASEQIAAITGSVLVAIALLGTFALALSRTGADVVDDEEVAEDLRERSLMYLCSLMWMVAYGLLLIGLSLAGPGGVLPLETALAGALLLVAIMCGFAFATWRLSDELMRTLSYETGNMAFYLVWAVGGGWGILAHVGLMRPPAPLDLVTMSAVLLFAASFIVLGRRKLFGR